ncbi:MAG: AAA family ATPase [Patescibacteria group bacterium]|jgi:dephospho-CoA kinase|nr:AAA family ATPase [Patescibacteria group bacterium]
MIIGISGTFRSGKDCLAEYLQEKYGLMHISTGDIVREIAQMERGSVERPILLEVADELRHKYGATVLVDKAIDRYHNSIRTYAGVIVTGIRSLGEAKVIKELGGILLYIDAPIELRYNRTKNSARDGEVNLSLEEFRLGEEKELSSGITDADFNLAKVKEVADSFIENQGTLEEFYYQAEKALKFI